MKVLTTILIGACLLCAVLLLNLCFGGETTKVANSGEVSFYLVPLVCGAAPQIGCGGRSKPILLSLEDNTQIREAWLNREGTTIAVVWDNNADATKRDEIASSIFKTYELRAEKISGKDHNALFKNFREGSGW